MALTDVAHGACLRQMPDEPARARCFPISPFAPVFRQAKPVVNLTRVAHVTPQIFWRTFWVSKEQ